MRAPKRFATRVGSGYKSAKSRVSRAANEVSRLTLRLQIFTPCVAPKGRRERKGLHGLISFHDLSFSYRCQHWNNKEHGHSSTRRTIMMFFLL